MFKKASVRLWLLAALSLCTMLSLLGAGFYGLNYLNRGMGIALKSMGSEIEVLVDFQHAQSHLHSQVVAWKNILLRGHGTENFNRHLAEFDSEEVQVSRYLEKGIEKLNAQGMSVSSAESLHAEHLDMGKRYREALKNFNPNNHNAGHEVDDLVFGIEVSPLSKADDLLRKIEDHARSLASSAITEGNGIYVRTISIFGTLIVVGGGLSLLISFLIIRGLLRQLGGEPDAAALIAQRISSGELNFEVSVASGDQTSLMASMKRMQQSIRDAVAEVRNGSNALIDSARELTTTSHELAATSVAQNQAAEETGEAVSRITARIGKIAESARDAVIRACESGDLSTLGESTVSNAKREMEEIAATVTAAASHVARLGEASRQIFEIVGAIRGIAGQTNLLALNAAIEAARAGEQGRGFAVVADEVRKLAERTTQATQEISSMISSIENTTCQAVESMDEGTQRVSHGVDKAADAARSMAAIQAGSRGVVASVSEISSALDEQRLATDDVARNVDTVSQKVRQNSLAVNSLMTSVSNVVSVAESLQKATSRFVV